MFFILSSYKISFLWETENNNRLDVGQCFARDMTEVIPIPMPINTLGNNVGCKEKVPNIHLSVSVSHIGVCCICVVALS